MKVRPETDDDTVISEIHRRAFPGDDEAWLVDTLRDGETFDPRRSLVAEDGENGRPVGHVLFTTVEIPGTETPEEHLVLAPVAVVPERQGEGIGSRLIEVGLQRARELGYGSVVLHGSTRFYPRFGFRTASEFGLVNPFDHPDENFMALELRSGALGGATGEVVYPEAFFEL